MAAPRIWPVKDIAIVPSTFRSMSRVIRSHRTSAEGYQQVFDRNGEASKSHGQSHVVWTWRHQSVCSQWLVHDKGILKVERSSHQEVNKKMTEPVEGALFRVFS
jgi:hypothetical protein